MATIILADDQPIVAAGIRRLLDDVDGVDVIGQATSGAELITMIEQLRPDVAVVDVSMPRMSGLEAIRKVAHLPTRLIVLSVYPAEQMAPAARTAGASGYVSKSDSPEVLLHALEAVLAGGTWWTVESTSETAEQKPHERLSPREYQVFLMLLEGKSISDIGYALKLAPSTTSNHLRRVREKIGVETNGELFRYATQVGLLNG